MACQWGKLMQTYVFVCLENKVLRALSGSDLCTAQSARKSKNDLPTAMEPGRVFLQESVGLPCSLPQLQMLGHVHLLEICLINSDLQQGLPFHPLPSEKKGP